MANKQKPTPHDLIPLILQVVAPLALSGGTVWLFTEFKQHFPDWLYTSIIALIAAVLIVSLILLIIRLLFGVSIGDVQNWIRKRREKSAALELVTQWSKQWDNLTSLIDEAIISNQLPSDKQEEDFENLRSWFIERRTRFIRTWKWFIRSRTPGATEDYDRYSLAEEVIEELDDPFSFFYQPFSIGDLAVRLKHRRDSDIRGVVRILSELLLECTDSMRN